MCVAVPPVGRVSQLITVTKTPEKILLTVVYQACGEAWSAANDKLFSAFGSMCLQSIVAQHSSQSETGRLGNLA